MQARTSRTTTRPRIDPAAACIGLCAVLSACAASPAATTVIARNAPPVVATTVEHPWRAVVVSEDETLVDAQLAPSVFGMRVRSSHSPDDGVLIRLGGLRARFQGGAMTFARDTTFRPIVSSAPDGDHWLFATADGALFSAPDFLGPLTRVGETSGIALETEYVSRGVLLSADAAGVVWMGGVDVPFAAADIRAFGPPMDLAFADRQFGGAILAPGTLLRTTNGGRSFEPVDFGREAAFAVLPDEDGIAVDSSSGWMHLGPTGAPVARARVTQPSNAIVDPFDTMRREFLQHRPDALETLIAHANCSPYRNGCIALEGEDVRFIARDGETTHLPLPPVEPTTPTNAVCRSATQNDVIYLVCQRTPEQSVMYAWDAGHWLEVRRFSIAHRMSVPQMGGPFLLHGGCEDDPTREQTAVCWFDGRRWRERDVGLQFESYAGLYGNTLAFTARPVGADRSETRFYAIRIDDSAPARIIEAEGGGLVAAGELFAPDAFAAVAVRNHRLYAVTGDPWHTLVEHEMPRDAQRVAFRDAMHGVAVGRDLRSVWITEDGAESWAPLELPIDGDPSSVTVTSERGSDVWCGTYGCVLGGRVIWAPRRDAPERVFAAMHAPMPAPARTYVDRLRSMIPTSGIEPTRFECTLAATALARGQQPNTASAPNVATASDGRSFASGGWLEEQSAPAANSGASGNTVLDWGGVDDRGSFAVRGRPIALPAFPAEGTDTMHDIRFVPRFVSRDFAIVQRCAIVATHGSWSRGLPACAEIVFVSNRAAPIVLATDVTSLPSRSPYGTALHDVLPLPDGSFGLRITNVLWLPSDRDVVLRVNRRGVVSSRRAFAWGHHPHASMLGRIGTEIGLVVANADTPRTLVFHSLEPRTPPRPFAELGRRTFAACPERRANTTNDRVYLPSGGTYGPIVSIGGYDLDTVSLRASMEVNSAGAACVRDITSWTLHPQFTSQRALIQMLEGAFRGDAHDGQIVFHAVARGRDEPLDCTRP